MFFISKASNYLCNETLNFPKDQLRYVRVVLWISINYRFLITQSAHAIGLNVSPFGSFALRLTVYDVEKHMCAVYRIRISAEARPDSHFWETRKHMASKITKYTNLKMKRIIYTFLLDMSLCVCLFGGVVKPIFSLIISCKLETKMYSFASFFVFFLFQLIRLNVRN